MSINTVKHQINERYHRWLIYIIWGIDDVNDFLIQTIMYLFLFMYIKKINNHVWNNIEQYIYIERVAHLSYTKSRI